VHAAGGRWRGVASGIDDRGRLRVVAADGEQRVDAGEISIRLA
jgi:hypothetical protein